MPLITSYLYDNKFTVQILDYSDPTIKTRNRPVYTRPIKVYQGIDNPVVVEFKNQDQKLVDLTGYTVQASIQDPNNLTTINTYAVTFANIANGRGAFTFDSTTISNLENRIYKLTFKTVAVAGGAERPLYADDNYGVPIDLDVLPAYYSDTPFTDDVIYDGGTI